MAKHLICCDWDQTLFPGHMHNFLALYLKGLRESAPEQAEVFNGDAAAQMKYLRDMYFARFGCTEKTVWDQFRTRVRDIIADVIEQGHVFSIVTFSSFPGAIKLFLVDSEFGLGLPSELANKIPIYHDCNAQKDKNKKEALLKKAENDCYQNDPSPRSVVFIDDTLENISASRQNCPVRRVHHTPVLDQYGRNATKVISVLQEIAMSLPSVARGKLCEAALARLFNRNVPFYMEPLNDQLETLHFLRELKSDHEDKYKKLITLLDQHSMWVIGVKFFKPTISTSSEIEGFKKECKEAFSSVEDSSYWQMRRSG